MNQNQYSDFRPGDRVECVVNPGERWRPGLRAAGDLPIQKGVIYTVAKVLRFEQDLDVGDGWAITLEGVSIPAFYEGLSVEFFRRLYRPEEIKAQRRSKSSPTKAAPEKANV